MKTNGHPICARLLLTGFLLAICGLVPARTLAATLVGLVDFNANDGGYTVVTTNYPPGPWTHQPALGTWSCYDSTNCLEPTFRASRLNSPIYTLPADGLVTLSFSHRYSFEADADTRWDGGQVRISTNNRPYLAVPLSDFMANGYSGTVGGVDVPNNELTGQTAFVGESAGHASATFMTSIASLGPFAAGDTLSIQFLAAWDDCAEGDEPNWEITSVEFNPPLEDRLTAPTLGDPALPADAIVDQDASHVLEVYFRGVPPPSIQWLKDGDAILDATNATYTISAMTEADAGGYHAQASNSEGSTESRTAIISYRPDTFPPELVSGVVRLDGTVLLTFNEPLDVNFSFDPWKGVVFPTGGDPINDDLIIAGGTVTNGTNVLLVFINAPQTGLNYQLGLLDAAVLDVHGNFYATGLPENVYERFALDSEVVIFRIDAEVRWRYNQDNIDYQSRTPSVFDVNFNDNGWPIGAALLGKETAAIPETIRTPVSNTPLTTYYRTRFALPGAPADIRSLRMRTVVDDGARVFLNGTEVFRSPDMTAMPTPMAFGAAAGRTVDNGVYEGPFALPTSNLVAGENVMAVALHQSAAGSSDNLWGCELIAVVGQVVLTIPEITRISTDAGGNVIIEHNGGNVYIQETIALANPGSATAWTTRPGGPHPSPYNAGPATASRFFRLGNSP